MDNKTFSEAVKINGRIAHLTDVLEFLREQYEERKNEKSDNARTTIYMTKGSVAINLTLGDVTKIYTILEADRENLRKQFEEL